MGSAHTHTPLRNTWSPKQLPRPHEASTRTKKRGQGQPRRNTNGRPPKQSTVKHISINSPRKMTLTQRLHYFVLGGLHAIYHTQPSVAPPTHTHAHTHTHRRQHSSNQRQHGPPGTSPLSGFTNHQDCGGGPHGVRGTTSNISSSSAQESPSHQCTLATTDAACITNVHTVFYLQKNVVRHRLQQCV